MRICARWIFPGDGPPLEHGIVTIANGLILDVAPGPAGGAVDLGEVALIPGLINAHTHLEFSDCQHPLEPRRDFAGWIRSVIQNRSQRTADVRSIVEQGLRESFPSGVTGLGEIATSDWLLDRERQPSQPELPRCLVFREILGLREEAIDAQLALARHFLHSAREQGQRDIGLSPHAPYSVHPELFDRLCELARAEQIPVAMHLAESRAEIELLQAGTGPLVELLKEMGLWRPGTLRTETRPLEYLQKLARLPRVLIIHGNELDEEEMAFVARHANLSVVYCPRTHAGMQPGEHPWRKMLDLGINVALGTDSRASNPDLSLWKELQFLQSQHPELTAGELLPLATRNGARALGWEDCGRIAAGQTADLCAVRLTREGADDPQSHLFQGEVARVMRCGVWRIPAAP